MITIHQRHRQTDRQTNSYSNTAPHYTYVRASRGNRLAT